MKMQKGRIKKGGKSHDNKPLSLSGSQKAKAIYVKGSVYQGWVVYLAPTAL